MIEAKSDYEWVVRLQDGENLGDALRLLGKDSAIILTGIGMVRDTTLGFWNGTDYEVHAYPDPCELVSLQGNVATDDAGERVVHAHLSIAGRDTAVYGGHFIRATAHNTVEVGLLPLERVILDRKLEANGLVGLYPRVRRRARRRRRPPEGA